MTTANIIYEQLGGGHFAAMTGTKNFVSDGDTLRMTLTRNKSKANRLYITLDPDDTYTMRFFRYTAPRLRIDHKKGIAEMTKEKVTEIKTYKMIYCDQLQELFTETTGLYTHF